MPQVPTHILQWLYSVLSANYTTPVLTYQDISLILQVYLQSLSITVSTKIFSFDSGAQQLLLNLTGFIPVAGALTVPFEIWFPLNYPQLPPIIHILTSKDTKISPNNHVDNNGKFYHPYLSNLWHEQHSQVTSNDGIKPKDNRLIILFGIFINAISAYPPLIPFQRDQSPVPSSPVPPPLPLKPNSTAGTINSTTSHSLSASPPLINGINNTRQQSPPPPPLPTLPINRITSPVHSQQSQTPVQTPVLSQISQITQRQIPTQSPAQVQTHAPPPLLPPNPHRANTIDSLEKQLKYLAHSELKQEFQSQVFDLVTDIDVQLNELISKKSQHINHLKYLLLQATSNESLLTSRLAEIKKLLVDLQQEKPKIANDKIDDLIISETPVYTQLYNLIIENESINDLLYNLEKSHDNGSIKFDNYLLFSRNLAREQCMLKLHIEKLVYLCGLSS